MKLTIKKDNVIFFEADIDVFTVGFCWMSGAVGSIAAGLALVKVINWVIGLF